MKLSESSKHKPKRRVLPPDFINTFTKSFQQILFLVLPSLVFIVVLRLPIVRLLLGAGKFDWADTVTTAWVLATFSIAIVMQSLLTLITRAFYATQETKIPVLISLLGMILNIIGAYYLTNFFSHYYDWRPLVESFLNGTREISSQIAIDLSAWFTTRNSSLAAVGGLAVSAGVASFFEVVLMLGILNRWGKILSWKKFWQPLFKKFFATSLTLFIMYSIFTWWNMSIDTSTTLSIIGLAAVVGGIGFAIYVGTCMVIEVKEVDIVIHIVKKVIARVKSIGSNGNKVVKVADEVAAPAIE